MPEEYQGQDPRRQDPNITTTVILRRLAIGAKAVFLLGGIAIVAATAGDPTKVIWIAIGSTAIAYSGDLLVGWGALRNYGALYEAIAELRAEQRRFYLDLVTRHAETRKTLTAGVEDEVGRKRVDG